MSFNVPEVVEAARAGTFGPEIKGCVDEGALEKGYVVRKNVYYQCPGCDAIICGHMIDLHDPGRQKDVSYYEPVDHECDDGGSPEELGSPLREEDLLARCCGYAQRGCPKCGSMNVDVMLINWD